jgi:hypothetical protein
MRGTCASPASYSGLPGRFRIGDHLLDWLFTGDGLFRERKPERDSSQQFAVDINGTAAHALHDAGLFEGAPGELGEDDRLLWSEVFEDTEDLDLELLYPIVVEDGAPDAVLAGADVFQLEKPLSATQSGGEKD